MPDIAGTVGRSQQAGTAGSVGSMMTMTAQQDGTPAGSTTETSRTADDAAAHPTSGTTARPAFRARVASLTPRWGPIGVAFVGVLALIALPVTLILGAVGVISLIVPLICVTVAVAAVAGLRVFAIRSRRQRVERAFAEAMAPVRPGVSYSTHALPVTTPSAAAASIRPTALFDAEETSARPLTAMELRTAALAVAHGASAVDPRGAPVPAASSDAHGATAWAPVALPRPTYVDAAKAERQAPAPLDLPAAPRPSTNTPIKASEAAARAAVAAEDSASMSAGPATGRINLDDVLQRRRA